MAQWRSTIKPAPGADGPFVVTTESLTGPAAQPWEITNVTLGVANIAAALDQAKSDGGALLGGLTVRQITTMTIAT